MKIGRKDGMTWLSYGVLDEKTMSQSGKPVQIAAFVSARVRGKDPAGSPRSLGSRTGYVAHNWGLPSNGQFIDDLPLKK